LSPTAAEQRAQRVVGRAHGSAALHKFQYCGAEFTRYYAAETRNRA
jgi:hypothetical protein